MQSPTPIPAMSAMTSVARDREQIKPLANADPYIDSGEMTDTRMPDNAIIKALRPLAGSVKRVPHRVGEAIMRWRLIVNQPTPEAIAVLAQWQSERRQRKLHRLHVAYDFTPAIGISRETVEKLITSQIVMKWRRRAPMLDFETTLYWIEQKTRKGRSGRDIAFYDDKPSKLTGEREALHFELRLQNRKAIRQAGFDKVKDLLTLDPQALFYNQVSVVDFDNGALLRKAIRQTISDDRVLHRDRITTPFVDQYRAEMPKRVASIWKRAGLHRAQIFKDLNPKQRLKPVPVSTLNIARSLSWVRKQEH